MIERLISPAILVMMMSLNLQNALIAGIYLIILIAIIWKKPYRYYRCFRPVINCILMILIQVIFMGANMMKGPDSMLSKYGPLTIIGLLMACVIYSSIEMVKSLKNSY